MEQFCQQVRELNQTNLNLSTHNHSLQEQIDKLQVDLRASMAEISENKNLKLTVEEPDFSRDIDAPQITFDDSIKPKPSVKIIEVVHLA